MPRAGDSRLNNTLLKMLDDFGLASDPRLIPSFVHAAVAKGNIEIAWKRFQEMDSNDRPLPLYQGLIRLCAEKQQPRLLEELELALNRSNKVTDNSVLFELVKAHTDLCQLEELKKYSRIIERRSYNPDSRIYSVLMQAAIIAGKLDEAESISASVKRAGIPEQPEYHGQLLQLQVRRGKVKKSDEIEQFMLEHKADQNHAAVRSSKIFSLAMLGDKQGVSHLLEDPATGADVHALSWDAALEGSGQNGDLVWMEGLVLEAERRGLKLTRRTYLNLLKGYSRAGKLEICLDVLDEARRMGLNLGPEQHACLVTARARGGDIPGAIELFIKNASWSREAANAILLATSTENEREAKSWFHRMKQGVGVDDTSYNCMLDMSSSIGDVTGISELAEQMKESKRNTAETIKKAQWRANLRRRDYNWSAEQIEGKEKEGKGAPAELLLLHLEMLLKSGRHEEASLVLDKLRSADDAPRLNAYHMLFRNLRLRGASVDSCLACLRDMDEQFLRPDLQCLDEIVLLSAESDNVGALHRVLSHFKVRYNLAPNRATRLRVVRALVKAGLQTKVMQVFDEMIPDEPEENQVLLFDDDRLIALCLTDELFEAKQCMTKLMSSGVDLMSDSSAEEFTSLLARHGEIKEAIDFMEQQAKVSRTRANVVYSALQRQALGEFKAVSPRRWKRQSFANARDAAWTALVVRSIGKGSMESIDQLITEAEGHGCRMDPIAYQVVLEAAAQKISSAKAPKRKVKLFDYATSLHKRMRDSNVQETVDTYLILLDLYSSEPRQPRKLLSIERVPERMRLAGLTPTDEIFAAMIVAFGRQGALDQAEALYWSLEERSAGVTQAIMRALNGAKRWRDVLVIFNRAGDGPQSNLNEAALVQVVMAHADHEKDPAGLRGLIKEMEGRGLPVSRAVRRVFIRALGRLGQADAAYEETCATLFTDPHEAEELFKAALHSARYRPDLKLKLLRQFSVRYPRKNWESFDLFLDPNSIVEPEDFEDDEADL
uniref:Pentacotripeptide-repeat region of PRORP domain-containing protein n=1 Tax=Rhodosorus marinus TaxID=101924 RepID=A0A7S2ZKE6_9RHOD|mmetsp:Transcript_21208/g.86688  ORF Transcript_21208/g.86688 Transcript_21208/m.86688 type:complete len:1002 (+) Transcript_21208:1112-4117(+)